MDIVPGRKICPERAKLTASKHARIFFPSLVKHPFLYNLGSS